MFRCATRSNDYLIDRKLQKTSSYTGIKGVSEQDAAVQDSQGPIADRTREHLGPTDLGIMHFRKLVMDAARALQQGEAPPHLKHQDRYAVRSGACVTSKAKDLSFEKEENEILDIKKHFVNPLVRVATDHMRWIAEDPRPVIKINPHEAGLTVAGGRLTGTDNIYWRIAQFLMPVHAYAPSSMPGENIFGQSFIPVTDTSCWIYTYAWNPERPLTQAERDGYDRGNGVMSEVDENYIPLRNKVERLSDRSQAAEDQQLHRHQGRVRTGRRRAGQPGPDRRPHPRTSRPDRSRHHAFPQTVMDAARALQKGEAPPHLKHQDRYAVRSGACVTSKAKDLTAVMIERFGDAAGYVGRPGQERGGGVGRTVVRCGKPGPIAAARIASDRDAIR